MGGFSSNTSGTDVVYAKNIDLSGESGPANTILTNGQLIIGTTALNAGGTHINIGTLTSPSGTVTIGYSSPNITLDISGGAVAVEHLTGNTGGQLNPTANNFNILGTGSVSVAGSVSTLSISVSGGGFTWVDVTTATQNLAAQTGYVTDHTNVTYTLPASGTLGDTILIVGKLGITTIAQNANQQILFGSASSTVGTGGSITGTNVGDCMSLICITAGSSTVWRINNAVGNLTVT